MPRLHPNLTGNKARSMMIEKRVLLQRTFNALRRDEPLSPEMLTLENVMARTGKHAITFCCGAWALGVFPSTSVDW